MSRLSLQSPQRRSSLIAQGLAGTAADATVVPWLREGQFGQALGIRAKAHDAIGPDASVNGPPDLVHWGRYFGLRSSQYLNNDFTDEQEHKDDDGYVGCYHYSNGLVLRNHQALERHVCHIIGLESQADGYHWKKDITENTGNYKKEMIVTYCTYNIFNKSDLRAKLIIHTTSSLRKVAVTIDSSYTIIPNSGDKRRTQSYNAKTIDKLPPAYWDELAASSIVRLFWQGDLPSSQLVGTVSHAEATDHIDVSINLLVQFLGRGHLTESRTSYGLVSSSGSQDKNNKISLYRNSLIDALVRLAELDISGAHTERTIDTIASRYVDGSFDVVVLRLLKTRADELRYLQIIHQHLVRDVHLTQGALILLEQVKFLILKKQYDLALVVAEKSVHILPLDYDCWYYLALGFILSNNFKKALQTINILPVILSAKRKSNIDVVQGIQDVFVSTFINRSNLRDEVISEKTFAAYFPHPDVGGSIDRLWHQLFVFNPHLRRPIVGNQFYQSPLMAASPRELSSVDHNLIRIGGPASLKYAYSAQSAGAPSASILEFDRTSTWGRTYDLVSLLIAVYGWDNVVKLKEQLFRPHAPAKDFEVDASLTGRSACEPWLDQMFLLIYEDLRVLMLKKAELEHSALEWEMLGLLGYSVKYNLKESISGVITSVMGVLADGGFDYFGLVKLLEIYDEFVLSDTSNVDVITDSYSGRLFSNKLILVSFSEVFDEFQQSLEHDFLALDFIVLTLMRLISWYVRWYNYSMPHIVTRVLYKLCDKHDAAYIRGVFQLVFERHKRNSTLGTKPKAPSRFTFFKKKDTTSYEFSDGDTILRFVDTLIDWYEQAST